MSDQEIKDKTLGDTGPAQAAKPVMKGSGNDASWGLGLAIVVIGALFLARNLGVELAFLQFQNWWAVFILLAAIAPLQQAVAEFRRAGLNAAVVNSLVSVAAIVMLALLFLLDLSFWTWWPVFLIAGGLLLITSSKK